MLSPGSHRLKQANCSVGECITSVKHCLTFQAFSLRQREKGNLESLGISASLSGILIVSLATSSSPGHSQKLKKKHSPGQYHCWNNFTHFNSSQGSTDNEKNGISLLYYCLSSCLMAIHFPKLSFSFSFDHSLSIREISSPGKLTRFGTVRSKCLQQNFYFQGRFR